jgi:hypothetical protein
MLIVREKLYTAAKALAANRLDVDALIAKVKGLVIGYAFGNVWIGALISAISILTFWESRSQARGDARHRQRAAQFDSIFGAGLGGWACLWWPDWCSFTAADSSWW